MEITLKKSWQAVTVKEYLLYKDILDDPNISDFEKCVDVCVLFSDKSKDELLPLPVGSVRTMFDALDFLTEVPKVELKEFYSIGRTKYRLISNIKDLTAGQFIDLVHHTKDESKIIYNVAEICSIFLMPIIEYKGAKTTDKIKTEKYLETPAEETIENLIENMLITEALSISNFFIALSYLYTGSTKLYLEETSLQTKKQALKILRENTLTQKETKKVKSLVENGSTKNGVGLQP